MNHTARRDFLRLVLLGGASLGLLPACDDKKTPSGSASGSPSGGPATTSGNSDKEFQIGWSVWTGWMPFKLMQEKGFLKKRADEHKVKIKLVEFKGYMDSVQAFAAKKLDGCAMTSMESLQPASNGVPSVAILINDRSDGGDGVLVREGTDLKGLAGKTVLLEEFSVSHYLLNRALESAGLKEKDVKIKNIPGDDAGKAFLTDKNVEAVATWNPHLFQAVEQGKGKLVFSSKDIPDEIMDFLVMNEDALKENPGLGPALTDAWFDAMAYFAGEAMRKDAIEIMAKGAGSSVEDFEKMLKDTDLFTDRKKTADTLEGEKLKGTMEKVKKFSFDHDLIKNEGFQIGFGHDAKSQLKFDKSYIKI
ncbi:MAG: ABC transporter substrate-binding protein [Polyangiaceae bacterium]